MPSYTGEYECKVDSKNRIALPSKLIKMMPEDLPKRFYISRGQEKNLVLYPLPKWEERKNKIEALDELSTRERLFKRAFFLFSFPVELDKANRFVIPAKLQEYSGITKDIPDVTIVGCSDYFEIWNTGELEKTMEELLKGDAYEQLSNEISNKHRNQNNSANKMND